MYFVATGLNVSFSYLLIQVTDLLGKFPDLMEEFNDFLERCENIGELKISICLSCFLLVLYFHGRYLLGICLQMGSLLVL